MQKVKFAHYGFLIIAFLSISATNWAQVRKVNGTVLHSETNKPLSGVSVVVKGATSGDITDDFGKFSINVPESNVTLVFSIIGYATIEEPLNGRTNLEIKLKGESVNLEEVVVVGYGTQKKATSTGAISSVKGSDLVLTPVTNVSNSLSGRLAGVFVSTGSSEPGNDGSAITIRGISTFKNSSPLIVVDGIPGRSLDRIDPNIIDNITVLKDASAAIYGAQAANGVILITTKRGKAGKPRISFSYNKGIGQPTSLPEMTNSAQYATMLNEVDKYNGVPNRYTDNDIIVFQNGSDPFGHPNTDWYSATLKNWSSQNSANLTLSGGSENVQYFVSGSTKFQDGFYKNSASNYKQQDFRINLDAKINKYMSLRTDIYGRFENTNAASTSSYNIFESVSRSKPISIAYWPNGLPGPGVENGVNPVIMPTNEPGYDKTKNYIFNSNINLKIDVPWVNGLSLNLIGALDEGFRYNKTWNTPWNTYTWNGTALDPNGEPVLTKTLWGGDSKLNQIDAKNHNLFTSALLNYSVNISKTQSLKLLGGVEKIKGDASYLQGYRRFYISSSLDQISAGGLDQLSNGGSSYSSARLNYFGRVNYNILDRFIFEIQGRYQGSYIFSEQNRFGFFPGGSFGYILSEEDFWKKSFGKTVSYFKIRASYGKTGNDLIDPYQYLASYNIGSLNAVVNGGIDRQATLFENVIPNPNATWESATQKNIGVDLRFFEGNLSLTADVFSNVRTNILAQRNASIPTSAGLSLPDENIGKAENKGFDFEINYRNNPNPKKLNYQIGFNGVFSKNKLIYWDETQGAPDYQKAEGAPLFAQLYYESLGIFKDQGAIDKYPHWNGAKPGDVIFRDVNNDGEIDANDRVRRNKTSIPTLSGGLSLALRYKGFEFTTVLQGAAGAERYIFGYAGEVGNYFKFYHDERWTDANTDAKGPRTFNRENVYWATSDNYANQSTQFLYKTDYIRLKTAELGYNLPMSVLDKVKVTGLRVYVSAYNLFTIANGLPKGFDPEMTQLRGYGYPLQKIVNFGLSLNF